MPSANSVCLKKNTKYLKTMFVCDPFLLFSGETYTCRVHMIISFCIDSLFILIKKKTYFRVVEDN